MKVLYMRWLLALTMVMLPNVLLCAVDSSRFIKKIALPSGQTVVIAEGDFEARSIGSFSVRLYDAPPSADMTTLFTSGLIRIRNGTIEKIELADVGVHRLVVPVMALGKDPVAGLTRLAEEVLSPITNT